MKSTKFLREEDLQTVLSLAVSLQSFIRATIFKEFLLLPMW